MTSALLFVVSFFLGSCQVVSHDLEQLSGEPTLEQFVVLEGKTQRPSEEARGKASSRSQTVQMLVQAF